MPGDRAANSPPLASSSAAAQPNLEPITADAHPPQNRRIPTQPAEQLVLERGESFEPQRSPPQRRSRLERSTPGAPQPDPRTPPTLRSRPSPAPIRRGLISGDRTTNLLASLAVGLLLALFPALKLAQSHEIREVQPLLAVLETAIEQPLAVEAGLVRSPESVIAAIDEGRAQTRRRFLLVWLLAGLPIGLGLGLVPRPGD